MSTVAAATPEPRTVRGLDPLRGSGFRARAVLAESDTTIVYEAEQLGRQGHVAAKLLRSRPTDGARTERFLTEGRVLAELNHPHIVKVHGTATTADERPFLVMERLRGRTLRREIMKRGALPLAEAASVTLQLLSAVEVLHANGVVHQNIRLDNVVVQDPGERPIAKLVGFGSARFPSGPARGGGRDGSSATSPSGTLRRSPGEVEFRVDIYSVGLPLAALVAGRDVVPSDAQIEELAEGRRGTLVRAASQGRACELACLGHALRKAVGDTDRFRSAAEFGAALGHLSRLVR